MALRRYFADQPVPANPPSFRAEHFPYAGPYPWLDRDDAETAITAKLGSGEVTASEAELCRKWSRDGYVILNGLFAPETLDSVWESYERAIGSGRIAPPAEPASEDDRYLGRYLNPHKKCPAFCKVLKHQGLLASIRLLMEREPRPLQTITSHKGSQQAVHSDSIHMTTYPLGYLSAAWIACEDIDPDSGPLVYYPGSHKLQYVFSREVGISESEFREAGYQAYQQKYEPYIRGLIESGRMEPHYFHAKKGDVLIWHANLLHGGSARRNMALSRKAIVVHFFVKGAFVYHDLAAARSRQQYMGTCLLRDENGSLFGIGKGKERG